MEEGESDWKRTRLTILIQNKSIGRTQNTKQMKTLRQILTPGKVKSCTKMKCNQNTE